MVKNSIWNDEDIVNSDFPKFFSTLRGLLPGISSSTREWTQGHSSESTKSWVDGWGIPMIFLIS